MPEIRLSELIPPSFYDVHDAVKHHKYGTYRLKGGRGSGKSNYIATEVILLLLGNSKLCAAVFMKHGVRLRFGAFNLYVSVIQRMGLESKFKICYSPMQIIYKPTGQVILFRGLDDAMKTKGITPPNKGMYFGITHFEELDQFYGMSEIQTTLESTGRGGNIGYNFECYNPPENKFNWVNEDSRLNISNRLVHHSTYLDMPHEWLGELFFSNAEALKDIDEDAYNNRYLGLETGTGGAVFKNVEYRPITDTEVANFDCIYQGADWGWFPDPYAFVRLHYDSANRTIYLIDEIVEHQKTLEECVKIVINRGYDDYTTQIDNAIPEHEYRYRKCGLSVQPAVKGPGSINLGLEWLENKHFVIDEARTPVACKEIREYEYSKDKNGDFDGGYMDFNNHCIDAIRYAMLPYIRRYGDPLYD